ncbi:MAG TPA: HEAT repeat domain-containing protein [Polyangiaceae bacterium]
MKRAPVLFTLGFLGAAGCAGSPAMHAAESGDRAGLASAVAAHEKVGDLSNAQAAGLARAVADRELREAQGKDALDRIRDARPCAHELDEALATRMSTHDDVGAEAALARIDGRGLDLGDARVYFADGAPRWRAVGARGLVRPEDHEARALALIDPEPHVRREAARAARDANDGRDLRALAEAARVDPEPIVRTEAVRAIAALSPLPNGEVADVLRDLWAAGDDGLREDIALAWASPAVWGAGGREALRVVVASGHGPGVVEAAAATLRHKDADGDVAQSAVAQLVRAVEQGARATRIQAIAQAPLDRSELLGVVQRSAEDDDFQVRVAALARLAEARQPGAVDKLVALGQPGSSVAMQARFALAGVGYRPVQQWLEQDLASPDAHARLAAATALASLGVAARAAPLLADADAGVRVRAACTLLVAARSR